MESNLDINCLIEIPSFPVERMYRSKDTQWLAMKRDMEKGIHLEHYPLLFSNEKFNRFQDIFPCSCHNL